MAYDLVLETAALNDIQKAIDYYDDQQIGLGQKFEESLNRHFISLRKTPFYQVRYDDVHCLPVKKYPYMVHFTINNRDKIVTVRAVFHTSLNPDGWQKRKS